MSYVYRHPIARNRPVARSVLRTLQKSDRCLLTSSVQVTDNDATKDSETVRLGDPLASGSQLYLDLQQTYINT